MWNKQRYCRQLQNNLWIQNFTRCNGKITMLGKSEYLFVVLWHGRSCQEMCGTILWVTKQDNSTTLQSVNSMHWWPSFQRRRNEIRGRFVTSMLSNCSEMLILGTDWKTWYSMVSEQTCTIHHEMDQSMWQTTISFDLSHSSYKWIQTILLCRKHWHVKKESQQNQSRWWTWSRDTAWTYLPRLHRKARGEPNLKVRTYTELVEMSSNQERGDPYWAPAHHPLRIEHWRHVVFSSAEIWWNVENKFGETRRWQVCHRWWYGLWHRRRIEPFSKITIILAQGEWSIAKDAEPFSRRFNARHWQTFYDLVNV